MNPNRIAIVGTSGSGKTYLAQHLSEITEIPWLDLDDLHWLPGWVERPLEEKVALAKQTIEQEQWIICGNDSAIREWIWPRAECIIWLDLPLWLCLGRALRRSFQRCLDRKPICNGNYESFGRLFSRDSILRWVFRSHYRHRRRYNAAFSSGDPRFIRLTSRREVDNLTFKPLEIDASTS